MYICNYTYASRVNSCIIYCIYLDFWKDRDQEHLLGISLGCFWLFYQTEAIVRPHMRCEKNRGESSSRFSRLQILFLFSPWKLGKFPILTIIFFQMGWLKPPSSFGSKQSKSFNFHGTLIGAFRGKELITKPWRQNLPKSTASAAALVEIEAFWSMQPPQKKRQEFRKGNWLCVAKWPRMS